MAESATITELYSYPMSYCASITIKQLQKPDESSVNIETTASQSDKIGDALHNI
jgi:hypothetical protein